MKHAALLILLLLAGCGESMDQQNRLKTYGAAGIPSWPGEGEALAPVKGTVSQGDAERARMLAEPPLVSPELLRRGQERYDIYCAPCHGLTGAGDGIIVARGFPPPQGFTAPPAMQASARRLIDIIGQGSGTMYGFSDRVDPQDRWAIVAYIRALQLAGTTGPR